MPTITENSTIQRLQRHIADGRVGPGQTEAFSDACEPGDTIRQGDLYLTVVAAVPPGYVPVTKPTVDDRQLVPGNTQGARHCLDSLAGVKIARPPVGASELLGPCLTITKKRKILHPVHGTVIVVAGLTILCRYQREWVKELAKARRAQD